MQFLKKRSRKGNILLVAIFISAFLFFLSVILVATNRQDILLAISVDHRMRASTAARAGANEALQIMRSNSEWEAKLGKSYKGQMASGATFNVTVAAHAVDTGPPYYLDIDSRGTSGFIASEYHLMVEEIRLADSIAKKGLKPHLFTLAQGSTSPQLMMLGPSFKWSSLDSLGTSSVPTTLTAGGGILALQSGNGTRPPDLKDWTYRTEYGFYNMNNFTNTTSQLTQGKALQVMRIEGTVLKWETMQDAANVSKNPVDALPNPVTVNTETVQVAPGVYVVVDKNEYTGPTVDWYSLSGTRMASEDGAVYSFEIGRAHV